MDEGQLQKLTYGAVGAVVLGAIGPWATAFGLSKAGTEGDGVITLIGAILVLVLVTRWWRPTAALVIAGLIAAVVAYDFIDISGTDLVSVGWGLYLSVVGAVALVYATLEHRKRPRDTGPETPEPPVDPGPESPGDPER